MKYNNTILRAIAALSLCAASCSSYDGDLNIPEYDMTANTQQKSVGNNLFKPLSDVKKTDFRIEDVIDDLKEVELKVPSDMGNIGKVVLGPDGDIFIMGENAVHRFSQTGDYVSKIGRAGRNDDEYFSLQDIAINDISRTILVLDAMNRVLFFNYDSGEFVKSVKLDWRGRNLRSDAIFPDENTGGFYIFSAKLMKKEIELNPYCIHRFNEKGVKTAQGLPCNDFVLDMCPVTQGFGNRYLINPLGREKTIWETKYGQFNALYGVDFEKKSLESKQSYDADGELDIHNLTMSDSYKMVMNVTDTKDYVSFIACGPEAKSYGYIYSKANGKNICLTTPDGYVFPVKFQTSDDDYFYTVYDRKSTEGIDDRACPVSKYITDRYGVIPQGGNPLLVGVKFNFDSL